MVGSVESAHWRAMTPEDVDEVDRIAQIVHPGLPEDRDVLAEKLKLHPEGCFILSNSADGTTLGYLFSHPWKAADAPDLDRLIGELPEPEVYYIHDIALLPAARGLRAGHTASRMIEAHARELGFERMALVSVNNSTGFWVQQGFRIFQVPELAAKLETYGCDAVYMTRILAENPA
ncbi:N-acetyltransferase [Nitratireductor aestuarii]|uniref:N-acetyltransferase n=2 Tax=Nitratireductor aestuarii TaxID=1735103 RepID=A0A916W5H3_9HYPH|nr:N-acetyltransferase [Nitratireductor aestuarii]